MMLRWMLVLVGMGAAMLMIRPAQAWLDDAAMAKVDAALNQLGTVQGTCLKDGREYGCADAAAAIRYRYELSGAPITHVTQFLSLAQGKEYQIRYSRVGMPNMTTTQFLQELLQ